MSGPLDDAHTHNEDRAMLRFTLLAIVVVALVFYIMMGFQVDAVAAADFSAETPAWVCPLTPFH